MAGQAGRIVLLLALIACQAVWADAVKVKASTSAPGGFTPPQFILIS